MLFILLNEKSYLPYNNHTKYNYNTIISFSKSNIIILYLCPLFPGYPSLLNPSVNLIISE